MNVIGAKYFDRIPLYSPCIKGFFAVQYLVRKTNFIKLPAKLGQNMKTDLFKL
jgi:hypothetical protein